MRHSVYGRKLSRTKNERRRLFQGLARDVIIHGRLKTSRAKAKAVQPLVEKLVTKAKIGSEVARRQVFAVLGDRVLTNQLFDDAKTRFASRTSGFTRIIKIGRRMGDASDEVLFSFVDERVKQEVIAPVKKEVKPAAAVNKAPAKEKETKKPVKKTAAKKK